MTVRRIFLAGIMQGSHRHLVLHDQDYRQQVKDLLAEHLHAAEVYDPLADHRDSVDYDEKTGREVFYRHNEMCRECDAVVAFVPEASMGTAIEMWEAFKHKRAVIAISPLEANWAIRYTSHVVYADIRAFETALVSGEVETIIDEVLAR